MTRHRATCDCGWSGVYSSDAKAQYALRRHSCEKQCRDAAAKARRLARAATVDRTPKPCTHTHTRHEHGTHACYVICRCRCVPCRDANTAYERTRSRQKAYGRWNELVDAQPARDHVLDLMRRGLGLARIGQLAGVSHGAMGKLIYGERRRGGVPSRRIRPATAAKILAVTADLANLGAVIRVDPTGTRRRLQALVATGWSGSKLAGLLGRNPANFIPVISGGRNVGAATARAVAEMYERLSMTPPPQVTHGDKIAASRARRWASNRGWPPPLAWDDDQLDDPAATPHTEAAAENEADFAAVARFLDGDRTVTLTHAERVDVARQLTLRGWSNNRIMRELRLNGRAWAKVRDQALTGEAVAA